MVKVGIRKPNLKSSLKARTTGKAKRALKRAVIPGYGKKGMGWVTNPKKAAYNAVYSRTTVGVGDIARAASGKGKKGTPSASGSAHGGSSVAPRAEGKRLAKQITSIDKANRALVLCLFFGWAGAHRAYAKMWGSFLVYLFTFGLFTFGWAYDIVLLLFRRAGLKRAERDTAASDAAVEGGPIVELDAPSVIGPSAEDAESHDGGDWELRKEEETRRAEELQLQNRELLKVHDVDVDMFTAEKVVTDVLWTIETMCPCMLKFDHGLANDGPMIFFSSPTKTGRVPKNVVEARISHEVVRMVGDSLGYEWPQYGDRIGAIISYLSDGRINKLDVYGNHNGNIVDVAIRRQGDVLLITSAGARDANGMWQSLCPSADPSTGELLEALTKEVERVY